MRSAPKTVVREGGQTAGGFPGEHIAGAKPDITGYQKGDARCITELDT